MVVERVGAFLREVLARHDGGSLVVIGHGASRYALDTRYGLVYWCGSETLEEIVRAPWPWLTVPIWRYELQAPLLHRLDTLH
jgi:broad specificity phosphatase PhoE